MKNIFKIICSFISPEHTHCVCCRRKFTDPKDNGIGIAGLGTGFCSSCFCKIMEAGEKRKARNTSSWL